MHCRRFIPDVQRFVAQFNILLQQTVIAAVVRPAADQPDLNGIHARQFRIFIHIHRSDHIGVRTQFDQPVEILSAALGIHPQRFVIGHMFVGFGHRFQIFIKFVGVLRTQYELTGIFGTSASVAFRCFFR